MNFYAVLNGINALLTLGIILAALFSKKANNPVRITYVFWSFLLCAWTSLYFFWGIQTDEKSSLEWLQRLMYPICLIHTAYFHFSLEFSDNIQKHKKQLVAAYIAGACFIILNTFNIFIDPSSLRAKGPFPYWPHATGPVALLIVSEIYFIGFSFVLVYRSLLTAAEPVKTRLKTFFIFGMIAWAGGMMNWFYWYDSFPIPPIGNAGITLYTLLTFYLVFYHDILGLNIAIKKTFIYALLTLFITLIYTAFILISEKIFQAYIGYNSSITTIIAGLTIALLFNPIRGTITKFLEKYFFGKNISELSVENLKMKLELQKHDRLKAVSTLAAGMAHEIKNPLTAIKTFTDYLPEKGAEPEFLNRFQKVVGTEIDKIDGIVRQLLDFSKPSPLCLEKVSLQKIIRDTLDFLNGDLLKYKIHAETRFHEVDTLILGDKKQLQQALLNLFLNAIQAMPAGGALTVSTSLSPAGGLLITIQDTGPGIPKEQIDRIFEPFFTTKETGTGLGLSIVKGIIEEHGGKIEAESDPGAGTKINLRFKI